MKPLLFALSFCAITAQTFALPNFDPFIDQTANGGTTYTVGSPLGGQVNMTGVPWNLIASTNASGAQPLIAAGNLTYPDFPVSTGNSVSIVPSVGMGARLTVSGTTVTTAYYSLLLKITDITAVSTNAANNYFAGFSDNTVAQPNNLARAGARLGAKKSGAGYVLGISKSSLAADYVYDTTVHNVDEVVLVVARYERAGGSTNVTLWVNPDASTFGAATPPAPSVTTTSGSNNDLNNSGIRSFVIICQSASAPAGIIDEVRVASDWAYVTGGDPRITQLPTNQTRPPGDTVIFTAAAHGTPTLTYQWLKDGFTFLSDGGNISGATTPSLTLTGITASEAGSYALIATNGLGNSVTSAPAVLSVADPAIVTPPQSRTNDFGTTATFSVIAAGTGPFTYQWLKNSSELAGATTDTLTLNNVSYLDIAGYSVMVTNGTGNSVTSPAATLTVIDPIITSQPTNQTSVTGTPATFSVSATGSPALTYQWKRGTVNLANGGTVSGAQSSSLTISSVVPADAGNYTVVVSGTASGQNITSSIAVLTVLDPIAITSQPMSRNVAAGVNVAFAVGVTGTTPSYQWRFNGADISGASMNSYLITNAQTINNGNYTVVISNMLNVVTSTPASLTVSAQVNLYSTNLVVLRGGNGAQALANAGSPIHLDQFTKDGTYVNTVTFPDSGPSSFIQNGISASEGFLNLSMNGRLLALVGYNYPRPYTSNLGNAASTNVPRAIATVNASGQFNLAFVTTNAFSGNNLRSAASDGTNNFWTSSGGDGTLYFGSAGTNVLVQTNIMTTRTIQIFNGELYFSSASASYGIFKMGGLPTSLVEATNILPTGNSQSSTFDFVIDPTGTNAYLTEDGGASANIYLPGIVKWTFDTGSSAWVSNYTLLAGTGTRGLTADFSVTPPMLYTTTTNGGNDAGNRLLAVRDTGPGAVPTTLATAGPNQAFRGVRFGPIASATPPTILAALSGGDIILQWSEAGFALESSTNVAGPYLPVVGATSPYTNSTSSSAQKFFRLSDQ